MIKAYIKDITKRIMLFFIAGIMFLLLPFRCFAQQVGDEAITSQEAQTQETITNLQRQTMETKNAIDMLQGQKAATQSKVNNLQHQSAELLDTVNEYSDRLDDISSEIKETEASIAEVSSQILDLDEKLRKTEKKEQKQYKQMKRQIKSTYMSQGRGGLVSMLYQSNSVRDFLNTTVYVEAVVKYNTMKIQKYRKTQEEIKEKRAVLEEKQAEIDSYQEVLDGKYSELEELTDQVMDDLDETNSSISSEVNKLANYDTELKNLDAKMRNLEAQTAAAQAQLAQQIAARLAASGQKENTGGAYSASGDETKWLAATIQAEADGESYTGKLAVGSVIMNRVKSSNFPNSIVGVITQNMQFASYRSGKVALIMNMGPNSTCMQAAQEVLGGARVGDYLFFMTKKYADHYGIKNYTMIGNHAFFYSWTTAPQPQPDPEPQQPDPEPQQPEPEQPEPQQPEPENPQTPEDGDQGEETENNEENNDN